MKQYTELQLFEILCSEEFLEFCEETIQSDEIARRVLDFLRKQPKSVSIILRRVNLE